MRRLVVVVGIAAVLIFVLSCDDSSDLTFPFYSLRHYNHPGNNHPDTTAIKLYNGQALNIDYNTRLSFLDVDSDSRCPLGAFCIQAGDAAVRFNISSGYNGKPFILHTNNQPKDFISNNFYIRLDSLRPLTRIDSVIKPEDYYAWLTVVKN